MPPVWKLVLKGIILIVAIALFVILVLNYNSLI